MISLNVKRLTTTAKLPTKAHSFDAGFDIYNDNTPYVISPGEHCLVSTGIAICPRFEDVRVHEDRFIIETQVRPRSGLAAKYGITVTNSPGTVDEGYRGEVKVILHNLGKQAFVVKPGDKIAQLVLNLIPSADVYDCDDIDWLHTCNGARPEMFGNTRGTGGFGSTGQ